MLAVNGFQRGKAEGLTVATIVSLAAVIREEAHSVLGRDEAWVGIDEG
jgi:hypothetical protein